MRNFILFLITIFSFTTCYSSPKGSSEIYLVPYYGRLGDQLLHYVKAKWISHKTGLPLNVLPNSFYQGLMIEEKETFYEKIPRRANKILLAGFPTLLKKNNGAYYLVSYTPYPSWELLMKMKRDKKFYKEIRELIYPNEELDLIKPPKEVISVAVHLRNGGGYDKSLFSEQTYKITNRLTKITTAPKKKFSDIFCPLKFPPEQYYIDQIKKLSEVLDHQEIYLFLFTDDPNPKSLASRIEKWIGLNNISFHFRKNNSHDKNVLADFFSMMEFDYFIRGGDSSFSVVSDFLSNHVMSIFPTSCHWEKDKEDKYYLVMDDVVYQKN